MLKTQNIHFFINCTRKDHQIWCSDWYHTLKRLRKNSYCNHRLHHLCTDDGKNNGFSSVSQREDFKGKGLVFTHRPVPLSWLCAAHHLPNVGLKSNVPWGTLRFVTPSSGRLLMWTPVIWEGSYHMTWMGTEGCKTLFCISEYKRWISWLMDRN